MGRRIDRMMRLGAALAAVALLTACADERINVRSAPLVAGNTYDRHNALGIVYPNAERINISYEFVLEGDQDLEAPGIYGGPAWLYVDRQAAVPERFVIVHLAKGAEGYEIPRGELIRLGQRRFFVFDYCLTEWRETAPPRLMQYLAMLESKGYALSKDIYLRQFINRDADSLNRRTDVVFIRDIMRAGYDCERIGNLQDPETDSQKEVIDGFKNDASGSFEVMG